MVPSIKQYAISLCEAVEEAPEEEREKVLNNFRKVLKRNHRLCDLEAIVRYVNKYYRENSQFTTTVKVEYAGENPEAIIEATLKAKDPEKEIVISSGENKKLIGGARIQFKDCLVDSSISSNLSSFSKKLK